ncbi:hypothetical protein [Rhizobium sp. BK176]|uniref:hypothetical protein n=1 Tax=Rhizobium sp. BK176 TaxID=2587071 RepID=UPI002169B951|nr:hypothetical protein [Rhizobium sp. BK176]MCS4095602.1 hypothetical protein [Rhizobium sp. BK176]
MSVRFLTAFLKSSGDGGVVLLENEGEQRTVIVEREALLEFASPRRADECRLQQSIGPICEIAAAKLRQRTIGPYERIRIRGSDVINWKHTAEIPFQDRI